MTTLRIILFGVFALVILSCSNGKCQQQWNYGREVARFRTVKKENDLERLKRYFESAIPGIPTDNWKSRNLKIFFSLELADIYSRLGDFTNAEKLHLSLVEQVRKITPHRSSSRLPFMEGTVFDVYEGLGYFYLRTGNTRKAEQLFTESASIRESVFGKRSVFRIHPLVGMGSLCYKKGEYREAIDLFFRAARMLHRATTSRYDYDKVSRLFFYDLAEICLVMERNEEARDYLYQLSVSASGFAKFGSKIESRMATARILELKSRLALLDGDLKQAQDYLNRANTFLPEDVPASDLTFRLLKTQAILFWRTHDFENASRTFLTMSNSYREHISRNFIAMSEYEKEQFYDVLKEDLKLLNAFAVAHHGKGENFRLFEEIYNNTLNTKALLLNESNKIKNEILRSGNNGLISALREWESAKARLSFTYYDKNGVNDIDSLEKKIDSLENVINLESQLLRSAGRAPVWQEVQATLKGGEAAMEIIRLNTIAEKYPNGSGKNSGLSDSTVYLALILKKDITTPECVFFKDGNEMEKRLLSFYRNSIFNQVDDRFSYNEFWRPFKKHLHGIKRVFISPDGVFNQLNLNTLMNPETGAYLIDEMELIYVTNTADLLKESIEVNRAPVAVLVGRPLYDMEAIPRKRSQSEYLYGVRNVLTEELENFREQDFADLPGTEAEILRIGETLAVKDVRVETYLREKALEEIVKAVAGPLILHIATHGFFVDDSASLVDPMIRSGLVLAGVENPDSEKSEDGILTAYEVTNLDLESTSLVTLSACETGVGEVRNGQGVYGLQRAIIIAGAQNLLMSLWKVDDYATAELMVEFYSAWKDGENQSAFRQAQRKLRTKYPQPFFWGAFIMLGR